MQLSLAEYSLFVRVCELANNTVNKQKELTLIRKLSLSLSVSV